jgi:hypothetical protein
MKLIQLSLLACTIATSANADTVIKQKDGAIAIA